MPTKHSKRARKNAADFSVVSFVSWAAKMIFTVLIVFCSRFIADQKSSRVATNLAYSSKEDVSVTKARGAAPHMKQLPAIE